MVLRLLHIDGAIGLGDNRRVGTNLVEMPTKGLINTGLLTRACRLPTLQIRDEPATRVLGQPSYRTTFFGGGRRQNVELYLCGPG